MQHELGFSGRAEFSLLTPAERSVCTRADVLPIDAQLGNIFTAFSAGLTAGAFVWGVLVDIIGKHSSPRLVLLMLTSYKDVGQLSMARSS